MSSYWEIGKLLEERKVDSKHGDSIVKRLALDILEGLPGLHGRGVGAACHSTPGELVLILCSVARVVLDAAREAEAEIGRVIGFLLVMFIFTLLSRPNS